jgi:hypothetical protein
MTNSTLERLAFICAYRIMGLPSQDSLAIPGMQYATPGKRRSLAVERIAAEIAQVFDGVEMAELESMMAETRVRRKA